jgi:hypothetical protein
LNARGSIETRKAQSTLSNGSSPLASNGVGPCLFTTTSSNLANCNLHRHVPWSWSRRSGRPLRRIYDEPADVMALHRPGSIAPVIPGWIGPRKGNVNKGKGGVWSFWRARARTHIAYGGSRVSSFSFFSFPSCVSPSHAIFPSILIISTLPSHPSRALPQGGEET